MDRNGTLQIRFIQKKQLSYRLDGEEGSKTMKKGKNERIHIRINKIEKELIKEKAKNLNMTFSDYIRYKALYEPSQDMKK